MKEYTLRLCFYCLLILPTACTYDQVEVIETCDNNLLLTITGQAASACGLASGSLVAAVSGGAAGVPLEYSLNGADFQESNTFTDLAAGSYTLTAKQGACIATLDVVVENSEGLNATAIGVPSDCGSASGEIMVSTSDAGGAVSFSLNGGPGQPEANFSGLAPGDYQVTARDAIGCEVTLEVTITSTVAFAEVETIVTTNCAVSGCHAGNVSPDFRDRATILSRASRIGARTGNTSMPPASSGRSLTQAQIDAIACWVADGAPE